MSNVIIADTVGPKPFENRDVHGLIFISGYVEEPLPDNFDQPDPLASDIVFTAQVGSVSKHV